jgi:hypothetical protein
MSSPNYVARLLEACHFPDVREYYCNFFRDVRGLCFVAWRSHEPKQPTKISNINILKEAQHDHSQ